MTKDEALKMAIDALTKANTSWYNTHDINNPIYINSINACKEALQTNALDEMQKVTEKEYYQEPKQGIELEWYVKGWDDAKKDWQGLTTNEKHQLASDGALYQLDDFQYIEAIEQELKTKNGFSGLKDKNT